MANNSPFNPTTIKPCYQLGQGMVEYVVVLAAVAFALIAPLDGPGSNSAIEDVIEALQNNYRGYSYAVTLSDMPDAISMDEAIEMYVEAGGDADKLASATEMVGNIDDFLGASFEDLIPSVTDFSVTDLLSGDLPSIELDFDSEDETSTETPLYSPDGEVMTLDTVFIDGDGDIYILDEPQLYATDDTDQETPLTEDDVCTDDFGLVRQPFIDTSTSPSSSVCSSDNDESPLVLDSDGILVLGGALHTNDDGTVSVIGDGFVVGVDDDEDDILLNVDDVIIKDNGDILLEVEEVDTSGADIEI